MDEYQDALNNPEPHKERRVTGAELNCINTIHAQGLQAASALGDDGSTFFLIMVDDCQGRHFNIRFDMDTPLAECILDGTLSRDVRESLEQLIRTR